MLGRVDDREASTKTEAIIAGMRVFAQKGFEAASVTALTKAMKINGVSMYATFGNKEERFRKAIDLYSRGGAGLFAECLAADTARVGVDRLLRKGGAMFTDPAGGGVCFVTQWPLNWPRRVRGYSPIRRQETGSDRVGPARPVRPAIKGGELPHKVSSEGLARFYAVVIQGLALKAQHGGTRNSCSLWWTWRWRLGPGRIQSRASTDARSTTTRILSNV